MNENSNSIRSPHEERAVNDCNCGARRCHHKVHIVSELISEVKTYCGRKKFWDAVCDARYATCKKCKACKRKEKHESYGHNKI
jgi:hypothetical protein